MQKGLDKGGLPSVYLHRGSTPNVPAPATFQHLSNGWLSVSQRQVINAYQQVLTPYQPFY